MDYLKRYQEWLESDEIDEETKEELRKVKNEVITKIVHILLKKHRKCTNYEMRFANKGQSTFLKVVFIFF